MVKTCCVPGCQKKNILYKFPLFNKEMFDIWKERIANPIFTRLSDQRIYHVHSVCHEHFIDDCKMPDKRILKTYSLPNINIPGFHEEPNIQNAFHIPNKLIDVRGQCDPKIDESNANVVKQSLSKNNSNLDENVICHETSPNKMKQDEKFNMTLLQTQPKEKQMCSSILRITKLKKDHNKRVRFAKYDLVKRFEKNKSVISSSRNAVLLANPNRTNKRQGGDLKFDKKNGRTQPVKQECTEKTDSSNIVPTVTLKNTQAMLSKTCVMSIVPYGNTYLCTSSEQSRKHSPLDAKISNKSIF